MIEATIEKLIIMKLHGMAEGIREQLSNTGYRDLSFEERFALLVDKERLYREEQLSNVVYGLFSNVSLFFILMPPLSLCLPSHHQQTLLLL